MNITQEQEIYKKAIQTWGSESQTDMAIEEVGELLSAIGKFKRDRVDKSELIDEIADVTIMMRQMALLHGFDEVEARIEFKLERLKNRLEKYAP